MKIEREDVVCVLRDAKVISDFDQLRDDIGFDDQGIDSLGIFSIILGLQEKYGLEIPDTDIDQLTNVAVIVDYLNNRLA